MKEQKIKVSIILGVIIATFNLISFVLPVKGVHPASFWLADLFMIAAVAFQIYVLSVAFDKYQNGSMISKIYGYPILRVGLQYVYLQFAASTVTIVLCTLGIRVPVWTILVVSVVLMAYAVIGLIVTDEVRDTIERMDMKHQDSTLFAHDFAAKVRLLLDEAEDIIVLEELKQLADDIRYSDPVTSPETAETENELRAGIMKLVDHINEDSETARKEVQRLRRLVARRREECMMAKKHRMR